MQEFIIKHVSRETIDEDIKHLESLMRDYIESAEFEKKNGSGWDPPETFYEFADSIKRIKKTYEEAAARGVITEQIEVHYNPFARMENTEPVEFYAI